MSYVDFKALIKKINLKPKGVKEIVLEVSDSALKGHLDKLAEMIDEKAEIQIESTVVSYNVTLNAQTNRPLTEYKVNNDGIVEQVKPQAEQLEADLDLPEEKVQTKEEKKEIDREHIDQFILEGLAPHLEGYPVNFVDIVKRKVEGDSFIKLSKELKIPSEKVADLIDEYRKEVAPLAEAWWNWKEGNEVAAETEKEEVETESEENEQKNEDSEQDSDESEQQSEESEQSKEDTDQDGAA
ncbi:2-methylcitrate dehydratase [Niallia sp. 01092]|uniref:2-methylcitrate dehydratase n=1 Tax=unclassified Niallia TaxID=2837522 RepID=UPI003FD6329A